jgi:hypothetical protein
MTDELHGTWPPGCVQRAFVAGVAWWQFHAQGSTLFSSERDEAEAEAVRRYGTPEAEPNEKVLASAEAVRLLDVMLTAARVPLEERPRARALAALTAALQPMRALSLRRSMPT